ncbi:hypothetical protein MCHI_000293 [Candidatus Magnetoovum chiemensis]|nr:hypothetical protein MCHI_000293 [Candidatus Magnetoovum chiemensis]
MPCQCYTSILRLGYRAKRKRKLRNIWLSLENRKRCASLPA